MSCTRGCVADADFDFDVWADLQLARVENALVASIQSNASEELAQAMRYSVLDGGKRIRPLLVIATAQAVGAENSVAAIRAACAVELVHAYSLVHDDMPCMDNDIIRRGKPTTHVQFGEAMAMLAGDALQALAFEVVTPLGETEIPYLVQARLVHLLSRAAGTSGMAGGQAIDLMNVGQLLDEQALQMMHQHKTGALLEACVSMGMACCAEGVSDKSQKALTVYGHNLGLAFQIVDDILDATSQSQVIGKTAGKDACAGKPTYVSILGLELAKQRAQNLYENALHAVEQSGLQKIEPLKSIASKIVLRSY